MITVEEFPEDPPTVPVFHADGTFQEAESDGGSGVGTWEATGATTFNLTIVQTSANDEGTFEPFTRVRVSGEVSADGQTFTAEFTIEFLAEGFPEGEFGPGHAIGTRINVEPMGTPAGSLEDLGAIFEGEGGSAGTEVTGSAPAETEVVTVTTEAAAPVTTEAAPVTTEAAPMTTEAAPMTTEVVATTSG